MSKLAALQGADSLTRPYEMFANVEPIAPEFSRPEVVDVFREYYGSVARQ